MDDIFIHENHRGQIFKDKLYNVDDILYLVLKDNFIPDKCRGQIVTDT